MYTPRDVAEVLRTTGRLLAFQPAVPDLKRLEPLYLTVGLLFAWLAGIGRYWDNPRAALWQHLGLGSVAYVFVMAFLIWFLLAPLKPRNWRYLTVVVFVALTSPPALLYAIPLERFASLDEAQAYNALFLLIVAVWRVLLLVLFLNRSGGLEGYELLVAALLPLVLVIAVLSMLNLERVVFHFMDGTSPAQASGNDTAYLVLLVITYFSLWALPILFLSYLWFVMKKSSAEAARRRRAARSDSRERT